MDNLTPRKPTYHNKAAQLERITQFRNGTERLKAKAPGRFFGNSSLTSPKNINNTTLNTNSRETTLETNRTQELDEYSKKRIEKETDAILEGDIDYQTSLPYVNSNAKKMANRRRQQDDQYKQNRTTGIAHYLSYLNECNENNETELHAFRRKLKEKHRPAEPTDASLNPQINDSLIGGRLWAEIMKKQEQMQELSTPMLMKKDVQNPRDFFKVSRLASISTAFRQNMVHTHSRKDSASSLSVKLERFREDKFKDQLKTLSKEFELFFHLSSKQTAIYDKILDYILDKPTLVKIFINSKVKRFREPVTSSEIYRELLPELEFSTRSPQRLSKRDSSLLGRKKSHSNSSIIRVPKRLSDEIHFFTLELQEVNMQYQLQAIKDLGDQLARKEGIVKVKFNSLAKRLYSLNRRDYYKFCDLINTIEKDRPSCGTRLDDKLVEFEKMDGELPLINRRTREIGKAWDNLLGGRTLVIS